MTGWLRELRIAKIRLKPTILGCLGLYMMQLADFIIEYVKARQADSILR